MKDNFAAKNLNGRKDMVYSLTLLRTKKKLFIMSSIKKSIMQSSRFERNF